MLGSVALALSALSSVVSVQSLLTEGQDLKTLAYPPVPSYTAAQASSFDRRSLTGDWFANGDAGQFVREETNNGRKERVMADLAGPGAVMRVWSANPAGTLRFCFDGEAEARFVASMSDLLRGKDPRIQPGRSYVASQGCNLYWPLPYAKSLKVTVEGEDARGIYYQVGYRTYSPQTVVTTFTLPDLKLPVVATVHVPKRMIGRSGAVMRGAPLELSGTGGGIARLLTIGVPSAARTADPNLLRSLWLVIMVDGETTVSAPLAAFFNLSAGYRPYKTMAMQASNTGQMTSRWAMPLGSKYSISLRNLAEKPINAEITLGVDDAVAPSPYRFRCAYQEETINTRPFRDMTFLDARGEGLLVGTSLHIVNPVSDWWGEGDEKIRVDGEPFPSTFGTGTEDYFGYAWSSNGLYQHPFMAQIQCDGPGTFGHSQVVRWHIEDPIPFTKSIKFDMEAWHWKEVVCTWERAIFWYGSVGARNAAQSDIALRPLRQVELGSSVKGATEGEDLPYRISGGKAEKQEGFAALSKGRQLWWMDAAFGDKLVLDLKGVKPGKYSVTGNFCHAPDYGIHQLQIGGQELGKIDFWASGVQWRKLDFGVIDVKAGDKLTVTCLGNRQEAIPRRMFGLDYLLFDPR